MRNSYGNLSLLVKLLEAPYMIMNQFIYLMAYMSAVWSDSVKLGTDDLYGPDVCTYLGDLLAVFTERLDLSENDDTL
jgi:hypothetical protein